jgi:uncharacterized protein
MVELPLFPLNLVLFPGMPISLHVFEERNKRMMAACLQNQQPFGVVCIRKGVESNGPLAEPYSVGCTAAISQVQPLYEGRLNVIAVGQERFRIHALDYSLPYLCGSVEFLPPMIADGQRLRSQGRRLRPWVAHYLKTLATAEQLGLELPDLPEDPAAIGYLGAFLLQIPLADKQRLLTLNSVDALLTELYRLYRREVTLLDAMLERSSVEAEAELPFSVN